MDKDELTFAITGVDSPDAQILLTELNESLVGMLGHNGTAHVCYDDFCQGKAFFLVGYDGDIPVCCAGVRGIDETTGEIKRVYARKNQKGIGTALMTALEGYARQTGYRRLVLECREGNSHAIAFYRRNGYVNCEKYPPYEEEDDAVCLEKRLGPDKKVLSFLIRAKRATYAGKGAETKPSRTGSHDLMYREGDLMYYDTYLGGERFAGEEALWISEVPHWSMNYAGRVTGDNFSGDFLKAALLHVPEEEPYRGPRIYTDGDYTYRCETSGSFDWFQGKETIEHQGNMIYECYYHGGMISQTDSNIPPDEIQEETGE